MQTHACIYLRKYVMFICCMCVYLYTHNKCAQSVPILDFCGPYAKLCWWGVTSGYERMNETHLSVFHSVSNRACGKHSRNSVSSAARYAFNSLFKSRARDFTTFTLHDLTDFYVERATAHHIKINDHSCFHNR